MQRSNPSLVLAAALTLVGVLGGASPADAQETRERGPTPERRSAQRTPTFYGHEVTARRVVFVIDVSGSMAWGHQGTPPLRSGARLRRGRAPVPSRGAVSRLAHCQRQLIALIEALPADAELALVVFSTRPRAWRRGLQPASEENKRAAIEFVEGLSPGGSTDLYGGLSEGLDVADAEALYLLSDGEPTHGRYTAPREILRVALRRAQRQELTIHTVAVGEADRELMQGLAEGSGGRVERP